MPENLWNDDIARNMTEIEQLVYRSNLLGADRSVCNIYGGNTSMKTTEVDHMGRQAEVLWVKGSGSDLANITAQGFAGLRMAEIRPLIERETMSDEEMVEYLAHTRYALDRPRQSIETLLHGFTPYRHVDHTHPDAVISIACAESGEAIAREIYGDRVVWVPYIRPGFDLSKMIATAIRAHPRAEAVYMAKHGLVTWGETSKQCYENTLRIIQAAEDYIAQHRAGKDAFGGRRYQALLPTRRREIASQIMPVIRGEVSRRNRQILAFDDSPDVLDFVNSRDAPELSQIGAACPDHLVHTKRQPLFVDWDPQTGDMDSLKEELRQGIHHFADDSAAYFEAHKNPDDQMRDPYPRVILIPGVGMITTGKDAQAADVSRQLYHRAIAVMGGSQAIDRFTSLTAKETYEIEYWPLELYKLTLKPPERELARRVVLVTGGASGIGRAVAYRLAQEGAHVVVADINREGAEAVADDLCGRHGHRRGLAVHCDVTDEAPVAAAFEEAVLAYGGVDILVSNAGIAASASIEETSRQDWERLFGVLSTGYFLVSRHAFRLWKAQGIGGSLIYVVSKNAVAAGRNAAAYSAAKAAELHLARCLAEEGGSHGIRVNCVLPDAVLQGSGIWDSAWRAERARAHGIEPDQLEAFYRDRTTLKVNVLPEDVAEAVLFFASDRSAKTTGGVLTVDGGMPAAYVR